MMLLLISGFCCSALAVALARPRVRDAAQRRAPRAASARSTPTGSRRCGRRRRRRARRRAGGHSSRLADLDRRRRCTAARAASREAELRRSLLRRRACTRRRRARSSATGCSRRSCLPLRSCWLGAAAGARPVLVVLGPIFAGAFGWMAPMIVLPSAGQRRRARRSSCELPELIDLLVVDRRGRPRLQRLAADRRPSGSTARSARSCG